LIDGKQVSSTNDFYDILDGYQVGDTVRVVVVRAGRQKTVSVTLQAV
jgi:S1-C subfamily serine protease